MLVFKKINIKRFNPPAIVRSGDLKFDGTQILVRYRWKTIMHVLDEIEQIRAYAITSWGLDEYNQIEIKCYGGYRIRLDGSLTKHQNFVVSLITKLGLETSSINWDFLPSLQDKMGRDIVYDIYKRKLKANSS